MEAVGQLTGGIAHDFNNLLTGITGSLEIRQMRVVQGRNGEPHPLSRRGAGSGATAAALAERLLAFPRCQRLDPRPLNVNRLVADMKDLIRRTVGPTIHLEVVWGRSLAAFRGCQPA
jgi:signal transduction histidine kinase